VLAKRIQGAFFPPRSVVIASGARYRPLDVENLASFEGSCVHYWASPLEGKLCAGQEVALVGGGNSAGQAAVYLSSQVAKVWLIVRGPGLEASMSRYLVDRITARPNVEILTETTVTALEGQDGILEAIRCHSQRSSEEVKLAILARAAIPFAVLGQRRALSIRWS
jgi:thioredoxin reductase (NADPH)